MLPTGNERNPHYLITNYYYFYLNNTHKHTHTHTHTHIYICVCLYICIIHIHNTHIMQTKLLFWMRLVAINHLTTLYNIYTGWL